MMHFEAIVDALTSTTNEVFQMMLGIDPERGPAYVHRIPPGPSTGIISVVGLAGSWIGTGTLCCSAEAACKISSKMLMMEYTEVNDDVLDAMAELTNMIIGNFKTAAEGILGPMGLSIPTVIYGMQFTARSASKEEWTVVPFHFEGEQLEVRVCLTPNRGFSQLPSGNAAATVG